jgi:signal transduction histidine kinase
MDAQVTSPQAHNGTPETTRHDFQRAMLNLLEDSDAEKTRLELVQTATLNILEDFAAEKLRFAQVQTATLNILEDFDEEKDRFAQVQTATLNILEDFTEEKQRFTQVQTATLNILEDFDAEKTRLEQSQRAYLNILEDIDLEKGKVTEAYQQIETVNKELDEFAYIASHDLKAPLRVIDNASMWLEEDLREHLTDETRENMKLLRGRVGRMEKLLDDLLEYSRIGRTADDSFGEIIPGDALMENILALLSPRKEFSVTAGPGFADILVSRMPLQQILMNLIGNAIKHHHKKGGCIGVTVEDSGAYYAFAVKDDGPGIAAEFHEQIFKMFQTLKPRDQVEGSGMGLAIVRKNIEVFGGTLNLESGEGRGSTFRFTWPKLQLVRGRSA